MGGSLRYGPFSCENAEGIPTPDPLLAKPITRLLAVKPHLPSCEDTIKAYKAVVR
jgi:hypothetical protein